MATRSLCGGIVMVVMLAFSASAAGQSGSLRGVVYDKDFEAPLAAARVWILEADQEALTTEQGHYVFAELAPGRYTLVVSKDGYVRQVRPDVVVSAGQLTDADFWLAGEFTEMEEFVVEDILAMGASSEAGLLQLRLETPAFMDAIGSDLMSRAGASDAAGALRLVAGATVADGRFAVIRGLPDRYVSSQMNGVRLPSADEDKRAVELDQFPAAVIDSIQVSKTFTPDQQGDASGGAVDVRLKGVPDENVVLFSAQYSVNSNVSRGDFLTYRDGGLDSLGQAGSEKDIQYQNLGGNWDGAVGVSRTDSPTDYKLSLGAGGKHELDGGVTVGGFANLFYEKDSSFSDDGVDDSRWVTTPGGALVPKTSGDAPQGGQPDGTETGKFETALFDVTRASQSVQWGGLGTLGLETERHAVGLTYLYTHTAEDTATLAEDTRGKAYFFPGHDPNDPFSPGNSPDSKEAAPYRRSETLEYTERTTSTLQLSGEHSFAAARLGGDVLETRDPELDWTLSHSTASLDQPDKRLFGSLWYAAGYDPGFPPFIPPSTSTPTHGPSFPDENVNLGNLQRIWKAIDEESDQVSVNVKWPFEQWSDDQGYFKAGIFDDRVDRTFDQDTFSNFGDSGSEFEGDFQDFWSDVFPFEDHPVTATATDVDYRGKQDISAWYGMLDVPLNSEVSIVGGVRFESTSISIVNEPEALVIWYPPSTPDIGTALLPGEADVDFEQDDALPSVGLVWRPDDAWTLRTSYSQTVARQTFKELSPIQQQEFFGGPVFVGNPELGMSALRNLDLRLDYAPYEGSLLSASWFGKDVRDPIEYVQRVSTFTYTTARNYPKGRLDGIEIEARQDLGRFEEGLAGLSAGANATFIDSEVDLPSDEVLDFAQPTIQAPITSRDMTNAPEHLYNLFLTYDIEATGTELAAFYTVTGDTLVAGAGVQDPNFIPSVYALEYGTLNLSVSQEVGAGLKLQFQAKNLLDPEIKEVYRSEFIGADVLRSSYTRGREYSLALSGRF